MPDTSSCTVCGLDLFAADATCPRCQGRGLPTEAVHGAPEPLAPGRAALDSDHRYQVLDTLGRGGMGIVYKVHDLELDEVIALKVLDPLFGSAPAAVDRFKRELKIARRINHPSVARLFDLFAWNGRLAISMEYIEGQSLDDVLARGPLAPATIQRYLRYICSALQAAHQMNVVHRDLKPGNILVDKEDRPHVLDFGIAFLAGSAAQETSEKVFGTAVYMSPEQAFFPKKVDHRSDIYSLGIVLYRMATGQVPFPGPEPHDIFFAHLRKRPAPPRALRPDLPVAIERVILKCLEKDPKDRFASAKDVYRQLESLGDEREVRHAPRDVPPVALAPGKRGRALVVDDEPDCRRALGDMLRALQVIVLEAKDGYAGVETALKERPDVVFLDLVMPVLDGCEALRILKSNPRTAQIPIVMLTSIHDPEEAVLSKELGAAVCLNKPVDGDVLELLVEKYATPRTPAAPAARAAADGEPDETG